MRIQYNGTPLGIGEYSIPCEDSEGREFNLKVEVERVPTVESRIHYEGVPTHTGTYRLECVDSNGDDFNLDVVVKDSEKHIRYYGKPTKKGTYVLECLDNQDREFNLKVSVVGEDRIYYSGTPTEAGTYVLPCVDSDGNDFNLIVDVIGGGEDEDFNCYLIRYTETKEYHLPIPNIQSIEETLSANLTEISTIVYGFDDNFVMDLGTTQRYNVTFRRIQPSPVNEQADEDARNADTYSKVDWSKSHLWSNGTWLRAFQMLIDGWQNLNWGMIDKGAGTKERVRSGGFRFMFWPPVERLRENQKLYTDLYPTIDRMAFISGSISPRFSGSNLQYLDISLPLTVGSMIRSAQTGGSDTVTYHINIDGRNDTMVHTLPENTTDVAPSPPKSWLSIAKGKLFSSWKLNGKTITTGQRVKVEETRSLRGTRDANEDARHLDLYAEWATPVRIEAFDYTDTRRSHGIDYQCHDGKTGEFMLDLGYIYNMVGGFDYIQAWVIGAGGAGGYSRKETEFCGGGGSGDFVMNSIQRLDADYLFIHAGKGGYSVTKSDEMGNIVTKYYEAEASFVATAKLKDPSSTETVYVPSTRLVTAKGGRAGKIDAGGAAGGTNGGRGGDPYEYLDKWYNGGGGIIPAFDHSTVIGDGTDTVQLWCVEGIMGGGGGGVNKPTGSSELPKPSNGGDGFVVLLFFRLGGNQ